ncbi:MAG: SDR family oxidoreductase [Pseudomonadota bacterium]
MVDTSRKTVLITGAGRGIGAEAARAFAASGWNVGLVARSRRQIELVAKEIGCDRALSLPCDVSVAPDLADAVEAVFSTFGRLDALVNNAGVIEPIARMEHLAPGDWGNVIDINLKGVFFGICAVLPHMLKAKRGTIVTVSSGAASQPLEGWSHYCSSKAGAAMLTRCLHHEYGSLGIRSMGLEPGTVDTDMQVMIKKSGLNPVSQLERKDHIPPSWPARALVWLMSDAADDLVGSEVSLLDPEINRRIGLVA